MSKETVETFDLVTLHYKGRAQISEGAYGNGRTAWKLVDPGSDEPLLTATVNIPEYEDPRLDVGTHVLIKDWSENEGVLQSLVDAGLIDDTGGLVPTGFCYASVCRVCE